MISLLFSNPLAFFIIFPLLLASITIHEFAHCWVTDKLGDPTPRAKGRLTLDPRVHLDPMGTLALLLAGFGWGRPAPFDPYNLKEPVRDSALIAAAGPISNILIAILGGLALKFGLASELSLFGIILVQLVTINLMLAVFNLIPVGPLDGAKVAVALLPVNTAEEYEAFMQRYGMIVLGLLIIPWSGGASPVSRLIYPVVDFLARLIL